MSSQKLFDWAHEDIIKVNDSSCKFTFGSPISVVGVLSSYHSDLTSPIFEHEYRIATILVPSS